VFRRGRSPRFLPAVCLSLFSTGSANANSAHMSTSMNLNRHLRGPEVVDVLHGVNEFIHLLTFMVQEVMNGRLHFVPFLVLVILS
jgi:hypothetical protein